VKVEEVVKNLIEKLLNEKGYILDKVEYDKSTNITFLRIIIDKENGIDIDDCVEVSKLVSPILDEKNPIEENYVLDVCSKEKGR